MKVPIKCQHLNIELPKQISAHYKQPSLGCSVIEVQYGLRHLQLGFILMWPPTNPFHNAPTSAWQSLGMPTFMVNGELIGLLRSVRQAPWRLSPNFQPALQLTTQFLFTAILCRLM
jgi:hypothetical protein